MPTRHPPLCAAVVSSLGGLLAAAAGAAAPYQGPAEVREARPLAVRAYVQSTGRKVLTLAGYAGAGYEQPQAMLDAVDKALAGRDPGSWIVNIGATVDGIGAAYAVAARRGFATMGIVSTRAKAAGVALAPCVDRVFYIPDPSWGGRTAGGALAPTSLAMVETGHEFLAIGGGEVTRDEMVAARRAGKRVRFVPADMNHAIARSRAMRQGLPPPVSFQGDAHAAFASP